MKSKLTDKQKIKYLKQEVKFLEESIKRVDIEHKELLKKVRVFVLTTLVGYILWVILILFD